jgi:DNA-binding response OmpR family regulator
MPKLLIVDDDDLLADLITQYLRLEHHESTRADNGVSGLELVLTGSFDVCILDWQMPNMSGVEVCTRARQAGLTIPILMLTSRSGTSDIAAGLNAGADDYLIKPFDISEFGARIKALLRRPKALSGNEITCGDITLSLANGKVYKEGHPVDLSPTEFALLEFLMRNRGKIFTPEDLLNRVWTSESEATYSAVTTSVKRIRQKLDQSRDESIIKTVHGIGYKIET